MFCTGHTGLSFLVTMVRNPLLIGLNTFFYSFELWIHLLIKGCIYSQTEKVSRKHIYTAPKLEVAKLLKDSTTVISSKKGHVNPSTKGIFLIVVFSDSNTHFLVPKQTHSYDAETTTVVWLRRGIFAVSPKLLVTHTVTENFISIIAKSENFGK